MQRVVPALRVESYRRALAFYELLGFRELWTHQFDEGLPVFACIARDGMELNLTEHSGDCTPGGLVHFYVPEVDALHEEFSSRGVPIASRPANSLGPTVRDMLIVDPDRNRLSFLTVSPSESGPPGETQPRNAD